MDRKITAAILISFAALVLGSLLALSTVKQQQYDQRWVDHTHIVRQMLRDINFSVVVGESVRRGYLLTGEEKFANGIDEMYSAATLGVKRLRFLMQDDPEQQLRADGLAKLVEQRFNTMRLSRSLYRTSPGYSKLQKDLSVRGSAMTDSIRGAIKDIDDLEHALLSKRQRSLQDSNRSASRGVVVLGLFGILLASGIFIALRREVARRRTAEAKFKEQAAMLSAILENMREGVLVYDLDGKVTLENPAATRVVGVSAQNSTKEERARYTVMLKEDGVTPITEDGLPSARALKGETTDYETICIRTKSHPEPLWLGVSATPLLDADGKQIGATSVFRDVTERTKQEDVIKRLNKELQQSVDRLVSSNRELEAFSYTVSHDLRGPLRAICGFTQALEEDYSSQLDATAHDYLRRVWSASQRMSELIDGLLSLTRITRTSLARKQDDLSAFAHALVSELQSRGAGRDVEFDIERDLYVFADPNLVHIVVENLLENAWKYTSNQEKARIQFGSQLGKHGERIFFVRDNGVGFNPENSAKLFRVFERLHSADEFPGNGIGLATVQRIIHVHGGRVWAESEPGKGATFFFTLGEALPDVAHEKQTVAA